jgi:hypothetical protein
LKTKQKDLSLSKTDAQKTIAAWIFYQVNTEEPLEPLPEETEEDSTKQKSEYKESARNTWIEKYMKNNNYRIHEN